MPSPSNNRIMIIAGDPSGDEHAAPIISALKTRFPGVLCFGIGGPRMEQVGFKAVMPFAPFNRMGLVEVLFNLPFFFKAKRLLIREMIKNRPKVCVLVDYPGFNILFMRAANALGIPVVWYIAPKVWAWKKKRAAVLGRYASYIATIFPFEVQIYKPYPAKCIYAGNPLIESFDANVEYLKKRTKRLLSPGEGGWRIAIVPGSRKQEIIKLLEPMAEAVKLLRGKYPSLKGKISCCEWHSPSLYNSVASKYDLEPFNGSLTELLAWADCAIVTSGTATLQTALMKVPFILAYKTSYINYLAGKVVVKIPYIGLPNIIVGTLLVPEYIQDRVKPDLLAKGLDRYMNSSQEYKNAVNELSKLRDILGEKHPSKEVAEIISKILSSPKY